ncbi:MAG: DUF4258 domain-containing protein [Dehalococcoidia bacterium]
MQLRLTQHPLKNMQRRAVSVGEIEAIIERPDSTTIGDFEIVYDGVVRDRGIRVVVDRFSDPPWVVTLMPRRR